MPLRDRDLSDVIALFLDAPRIDERMFWTNCDRTENTRHIAVQLIKLQTSLKSGEFREAWSDYYGEKLSLRDVLLVIEKTRSLLKVKP